MITKDYLITSAEGLHARPATNLVRLAKKFKSVTSLKKGDKTIKLTSMLNILSLGLKGGDTITVIIEGEDEAAAAAEIDTFFTEELKHQ
jgi:phosphocarrier protein